MTKIIDLASRAKLRADLQASADLLARSDRTNMEEKRQIAVRAKRTSEGRQMICEGLDVIRANASPADAIAYLRDMLAAIEGST